MGERDAFGNEKGEDTLAGLGWTSGTGPSAPAPAPASAPVPAPVPVGSGVGAASANEAFGALPPPPPARSSVVAPGVPRVNRPSAGLRLVGVALRVAVPIVVLLVVGGTLFSVGDKVSSSVDDVRRAISTGVQDVTVPTATAEDPARPVNAPVGLGKGSLLKAGNLRHALALLRREGSRARSLRVAPERVDATLVTASGFIRQVEVTWRGERHRTSQTGPGFTQASTFPIAGLDVGAPARLTRSAAGRAKGGPSKVDYIVAIPTGAGGGQGWTVILKDRGGQYLADSHGRITRRIN